MGLEAHFIDRLMAVELGFTRDGVLALCVEMTPIEARIFAANLRAAAERADRSEDPAPEKSPEGNR